ncbi:putative TIR domain-containing protein [Helianthus annuus]|nr:putative TIR domain-containing protein [Helianthus annuus]
MMLPFASSSSSTTVSQFYDVFMSFRGEDTRMTFTSHLYDALIENGIITYKDDRTLGLGKPIAPELLKAIETSKIAVVILSRQYATSKWCLQELKKIVDCMKLGKLIVIPIFYHVTPSDVRHQSDCFEQAFSNHDANTEIAPGKVNIWRAAFEEVGALSGSHVTKDK